MNRITSLFERKQHDILSIYFTAGYPNLHDTSRIIETLASNGVDLVEIGMPYSDPLADGTTIQESGNRALANGMSLELLFKEIALARSITDIPFIMMGHYNQVIQFGEEKFIAACVQAGVDGLILPDLPLDIYEREFKEIIARYDLKMSFLITPQTEEKRIKKIAKASTAFVYMVSSFAITGVQAGISAAQIAYFQRVSRMKLNRPLLIGFGIHDANSFTTACQHANGAIIGSAFIKAIAGKQSEELTVAVAEFVQKIKGNVTL